MNNTYYLDGGLINSYPLNECLDCSFNKNEILSIVVKNERSNEILNNNNNNNNIFTFGWCILNNILNKGQDDYYKNGSIKYELIITCQNLNFNEAIKMIKEKSNREEIINEGEKYANLFLNYITKQCL
jgi:predicted patatin/cPLA2 family phospholipase